MNAEERLRDAIHAYADRVHPPDAWGRIRARTMEQRRPRWLVAVAGLAAAALGVAAVILIRAGGDDRPSIETPAGDPAGAPPTGIVAATTDGRVVLLDALTGAELRTPARGGAGVLAVAPDGERVIFDRPSTPASDPPREIVSVPLRGGEVERLIGGAGQPTISPDGRLLAFTRYEPPIFGSYQPRSVVIVELPERFDNWVPNVIASGEIVGEGSSVIALSWAPDSRRLLYTVVGTLEGSPPRVVEIAEGMALDQASAIPGVVEGGGCAEATFMGDTGLVLSVRALDRVVAIEPETGTEVRELFRGPGLGCVSQAPVSDSTGRHVLYTSNGGLYTWSEGDAAPTRLADHIEWAAWLPRHRG